MRTLIRTIERRPTLQLVTLLAVAMLQACSSSTSSPDHTGSSALRHLESGWCPGSIVNNRGQDARGKTRYDRSAQRTGLDALRAREIANCQRLVDQGDTSALATLVDYYDISSQQAELVQILERYVAVGTDSQRLSQAGTYLYQTYAQGSAAVARNPGKAFNYLGLAVNNGASALEINYARALTSRGLYLDAEQYFSRVLSSSQGRSSVDRCEANLGLAYIQFGLAPERENWNTAYFHWRQGLSLAMGKEWASCAQDNFTSPHYSYEAGRKAYIEERVSLMSAPQKQIIDEARLDPRKGLAFAAALDFRPPASRPAGGRKPATYATTTPSSAGVRVTAGSWQPLNAQICRLQSIPYSQPWSNVFESNSEAIWTVDSQAGSTRSTGTAVAVSSSELITNCHLINDPANISIRRVGSTLQASLLYADRDGDRCVLKAQGSLPTYVQYGRRHDEVRIGEEVAAIGNPRGLETSLSRGIVGQKRSRHGLKLIQTDAAISSGSSGGGLFDQAGNLVGITTFTVSDGQSLNFAIAIEEFCH
ncbi:serine protease [Halioglobus maricola]|uniref:Serine protease n=1 Tax=Halioglobus maricola TaxID=2601894 RepID=A0A5P9NN48_9GAMM|nr:S1C family serine protease [Halioglobus maricola]QFU76895.1 serine protease [Halioglobus maricola]